MSASRRYLRLLNGVKAIGTAVERIAGTKVLPDRRRSQILFHSEISKLCSLVQTQVKRVFKHLVYYTNLSIWLRLALLP